jgi:tetratricopeptide (TPR) repeat protein
MKNRDSSTPEGSRADDKDEAVRRGMTEKYYHSMGARLCDEGKFDEAIRYFRRAPAFGEEPFTRFHCGLAYGGKGDSVKAIEMMTRAIELNPSVPEYYHQRGLMWHKLGDEGRAASDYERALAIDEDYGRIEEVKAAVESVEAGLEDRSILDVSCPIVSCPAFCCHFSGDLALHGVHIGPWKLRSIRMLLKEKGIPEGEFIEKMAYGGEKHLRMLVPRHYIVKEGDRRFIYYPGRGPEKMDKSLLKDLPKGRDYRTLVWITENSRPCSFLKERRCMIHDAGDEAGLESCKQFLCLTGFVFVVLYHLGLIEDGWTSGREMGELNELALEALLLLGRGKEGNDALATFLQLHRNSYILP